MAHAIDLARGAIEALEARVLLLEGLLRDKNDAIRALQGPDAEFNGLLVARHRDFLTSLEVEKDTMEFVMTEHLRVQGVFWTLGSMDLLSMENTRRDDIVKWVMTCYDAKRGGFGGNTGHDAHLLYTQHAIYVLAQCHALDELGDKADAVVAYVKLLQRPDGSFAGDEWGEIDTRFSYCAAVTLAVLGRLDAVDGRKACEYIISTRNELDGGFGCARGVESHAGYIFTALGALSVWGGLDLVDHWDGLAWWLSERQCESGGLNGRPEKLADVCYSWWVLSSLSVLDRLEWIDGEKLVKYILNCQDPEKGGIADHPNNCGDVYHTFFGLCGLSLLGFLKGDDRFGEIDPVFALPRGLVRELGLVSHKATVIA